MGDILFLVCILAAFGVGVLPTLKLLLLLQKRIKNKFLSQWAAPFIASLSVCAVIFSVLALVWHFCGPFLTEIVNMLNNL